MDKRQERWNQEGEAERDREAAEFFAKIDFDEDDLPVAAGTITGRTAQDEEPPVSPWLAKQFGTVREVAGFFRVHWKTIEQWRRKDGLPCLRHRGVIRYDLSDVLRWASARKEGV